VSLVTKPVIHSVMDRQAGILRGSVPHVYVPAVWVR
jgi:hypothetical protein